MGEAKRRGSYEQRKAEAEQRALEREIEREADKPARRASNAAIKLSTLAMLALAMGSYPLDRPLKSKRGRGNG